MKAKSLILTILIAALVSVLSVTVMLPDGQSGSETEIETAYERVMRTGVLRCGYTIWPPFYDLDPNTGEVVGLMRDVTESMAGLLGLEVDYVAQYTIGSEAADLESGKFDAICNDGPWNVNGAKYRDFSYIGSGFAHLAFDGRRFKNNPSTIFDQLNSEKVTFIGIDGDWSEELPRNIFPKAKLTSLPNTVLPSELLLNIDTGKAQAAIMDHGFYSVYMRSNPDSNVVLSKKAIAAYPFGFSVAKGEDELLRTFDLANEILINAGVYQRIRDKYDVGDETMQFLVKRYQEPAP